MQIVPFAFLNALARAIKASEFMDRIRDTDKSLKHFALPEKYLYLCKVNRKEGQGDLGALCKLNINRC